MLKKIMIGLAAFIAVFLVIVALQSPDYAVSRSAVVNAPPAKVFAVVNNIRRWNDWSPWAKMDPSQQVSYEGPAAGVGAVQIWEGKKTGSGRMTLIASEPGRRVGFKMEFYKPMAGTADVEFTLAPEGKGTAVTWSMTGKNNFVGKAMCLVMSMDRMIGPMFEQGLAAIKPLVEAPAK